MAIRKDTVQLQVEINGKKAGQSYGQLIKSSRTLKKELLALTPGTQAFINKSAELKKVNGRLAGIRKQTQGVKKGLSTLSVAGLVASVTLAVRSVLNLGKETLKLFNIQAQADAQLKAAIASTNGAAGKSYDDLKKKASEFQTQSLFGDESIQKAQATLLTFTKIQGDVFDEATQNILDYSQRLGVDLQSASIQVGKALNDPIKGISALGRAGVQFSESQKATIATLQQTGDIAGAQTIILKELETQFGGSAKAAAEAGTGGYTQLSNRIGDVQEVIGKLTVRGTRFLLPFLNKAVDFADKFAQSLESGEKATGKYGAAINFVIGLFQILFKVGYDTLAGIRNIGNGIAELFTQAKDLPIIGGIFRGIATAASAVFTVISDGTASFAGLRGAVNQAVQNIKLYFIDLLLAAQIMAKELDLALSIKSSTKERLRQEIEDLKSLRVAAADTGKSVGAAYVEARDQAIAETTTKKAKEDPAAYLPPAVIPVASQSSGSTTNTSGQQQARTPIAALEQIASIGPKEVEISADEIAARRIAKLEADTNEELLITEKGYLQKLFSEEEYGLRRLELLAEQKAQELQLLEAAGLTESDLYLQTEVDKLNAEKDLADERIAVKQREIDMKRQIEQQGIEAFGDVVNMGISLLAKDEKARRRAAVVAKSFEAAKVAINSAREISDIYKSTAGAGPAGWVVATFRAVSAAVRAGKAIASIKAQQFYKGGRIPLFTNGPITGTPNVTPLPGGDNMLAYIKTGETMINEEQKARLGGDEAMRLAGVPGYNTGGITGVSTTPAPSVAAAVSGDVTTQSINDTIDRLNDTVSMVMQWVSRPLKADVVFEEVQSQGDQLARTQAMSSL